MFRLGAAVCMHCRIRGTQVVSYRFRSNQLLNCVVLRVLSTLCSALFSLAAPFPVPLSPLCTDRCCGVPSEAWHVHGVQAAAPHPPHPAAALNARRLEEQTVGRGSVAHQGCYYRSQWKSRFRYRDESDLFAMVGGDRVPPRGCSLAILASAHAWLEFESRHLLLPDIAGSVLYPYLSPRPPAPLTPFPMCPLDGTPALAEIPPVPFRHTRIRIGDGA